DHAVWRTDGEAVGRTCAAGGSQEFEGAHVRKVRSNTSTGIRRTRVVVSTWHAGKIQRKPFGRRKSIIVKIIQVKRKVKETSCVNYGGTREEMVVVIGRAEGVVGAVGIEEGRKHGD